MQDLHMWRPVVISSSSLQLSYDREIQLSFDCNDFVPDLTTANIEYIGKLKGKAKGGPTDGLFVIVRDLVSDMTKANSVKSLPEVNSTIIFGAVLTGIT